MSTIIIDNSNIESELSSIILETTFFKNKVINLNTILENEKILIWENKIYKDTDYSFFQPITRFFLGQSRFTIQTYFDSEFKPYFILLNKLSNMLNMLPSNDKHYLLLVNNIKINVYLIISILPGIIHIRNYYHNNPPDINLILNPIIYTLTEFKNKNKHLLIDKKHC